MKIRTYEREKLYKEVWSEPMTTVAKRYGISDVALRKHCKKLEIPLPPVGYWAKVKAGIKKEISPMPMSKGPNKIEIVDYSITQSASGVKISDTLLFMPEDQRMAVKNYCASVIVPAELENPLRLIKDTIQYLRS